MHDSDITITWRRNVKTRKRRFHTQFLIKL